MSIYVDGMFYRCSGVGRVYENLMAAFAGHPGLGEIHTIVPLALKSRFLERFPHPAVRPRFVGYGPMGVGDLVLKSAALRSLRGEVRLYFFPGHNVPLSVPGRYIVSVNDVTVFSPRFELPSYRKAGFHWLVSRAVHRAEAVVTISETVKGDLVREFGLPPEKIRVIYPWVKEIFFGAPGDEPPPECLQGKEYILYVGLRIAHKNVEGVIRAFMLLVDDFPELRLVVAGGRYTTLDMVDRWKADPRLAGRLIEISSPSDGEILRLLSRAKAFVFPSFAEGFGLPPLEAMAAGVPVVCSDIPVFREVYGEAVLYVDPNRPESIAAALRALLVDPSLSADLRAGGKKQASKYRRNEQMARYIDLLAIPPEG
ncbi:MAG: glycosyltransferase family 4 protein [Deltaproteobacteria bacterium]|nr:glycosyltransferase family 4 protein [Deltaproteobacteria bacterium]